MAKQFSSLRERRTIMGKTFNLRFCSCGAAPSKYHGTSVHADDCWYMLDLASAWNNASKRRK